MPLRRVADQPTWLLSQAHARAQSILQAAFAREGVRGYHYRLMAALEQLGPTSQAGLGRSTGIDGSDVVAVLNDLAASGWVSREPDPADRRRNVVTLTGAGLARLIELDAVLAAVQREVIAPLSAAESRTLAGLLARLVAAEPR